MIEADPEVSREEMSLIRDGHGEPQRGCHHEHRKRSGEEQDGSLPLEVPHTRSVAPKQVCRASEEKGSDEPERQKGEDQKTSLTSERLASPCKQRSDVMAGHNPHSSLSLRAHGWGGAQRRSNSS